MQKEHAVVVCCAKAMWEAEHQRHEKLKTESGSIEQRNNNFEKIVLWSPGTDGVEQQPNQEGYINQLSDGSYVGGFEQHTELNKMISVGLQALHGRKVDVAQDLRITIDKNGTLKATLMHGTFPSVSATMNGKSVYQFAQHSFLLSHSKTANPSDIRFSIKNVIEGKMRQEASDKVNLINRSKQAPYLYFGGFNSAPVNPKTYSAISWNY